MELTIKKSSKGIFSDLKKWTWLLTFPVTLFICTLLTSILFCWLIATCYQISIEEALNITKDRIDLLAVWLVISTCITLITIIFFKKWIDGKPSPSLGFEISPLYQNDFLHGCYWGTGTIAIVFASLLATGAIKITTVSMSGTNTFIYFIIYALVALKEEVLSRGYILNRLMEQSNRYVALLISSLIFAALHLGNPHLTPLAFLNLVLAGGLLGVYYLHKRNLWFPIGMHFAWNFVQGVIFGSPVSGKSMKGIISYQLNGYEWITGGAFGFEGSILVTIVSIVSIVVLHYKYKDASPQLAVNTI